MTVTADVLVAEQISPDQQARITSEFAALGLTAQVRVIPPRRSIDTVAWLILAALPLQPFLTQLTSDFADDAYLRLKGFVGRVLHRRQADAPKEIEGEPKPVLVLLDTATGVQVVLEPDLPAESYRQLLTFDLASVKHGPLHYDMHRQRWRSELDEQL